jgi:hypothetical protein
MGVRFGSRTRRAVVALTMAVVLLAFGVEGAGAVADEGEYPGPSAGPTAPTAEKPESKLWFTDGTWWSVMIGDSGGHRIFRLNADTQVWSDTGVVVDTRTNAHVDVLFRGSKLYVASHVFRANGGQSGTPSNLYRFSYNAGNDQYSLDAGFPQQINNWGTETLVIAKDSLGRLWATWTQGTAVWVNRTTSGDSTWGTPFALPNGGGIATDDISSIIAYGGNRIGIMWSDQGGSDESFKFVSRGDSDTFSPTPTFSGVEQALAGDLMADDHLNLKADSTGRIFVAAKTSLEGNTDPQAILLIRGAGGGWTNRTFGRVVDDHTRPIVLIYERQENPLLFYVATASDLGEIYLKRTSLANPSFATGLGEPIIDDAAVNDPTSTKDNLTDASELLVQASGSSSYRHYWEVLPK